MADLKALARENGMIRDTLNADRLLIGGIDFGIAGGTLTIGTVNATALSIGDVGVVTTVLGDLSVNGIFTIVDGGSMFGDGNITLGGGDGDTITLGGSWVSADDIVYIGTVNGIHNTVVTLRCSMGVNQDKRINFDRTADSEGALLIPDTKDAPVGLARGMIRVNAAGAFEWYTGAAWVASAIMGAYTLDDAYNAGLATVIVDAYDVTWNLTGAFSHVTSLAGCTGVADGFFVEDGTDYWRLTHVGANTLNLSAELGTFDVNANGAVTVDAAGANTITIGGDANTGAIGVGIGASARLITVGNVTAGTNFTINTPTGSFDCGIFASGKCGVGIGAGSLCSTGWAWTALGISAALSQASGYDWVSIGYEAVKANTDGTYFTVVGSEAALANVHGGYFSVLGASAAHDNIAGSSFCAIGRSAGYCALGSGWVALGDLCNRYVTTGDNWISIGNNAGSLLTDGATHHTLSSQSIYIGAQARAGIDNETNEVVIGYGALGLGSNSVAIGNASTTVTALRGNVGIGVESALDSKLTVKSANISYNRSANIRANGGYNTGGNSLFWGADSTVHFASMGAMSTSGNAFVGFGCYHSNTAETLKSAFGAFYAKRIYNSQTAGLLTIDIGDGVAVDTDIPNWYTALSVSNAICVGIGGATAWGTSARGVLAIKSGTAPTTSPADTIQMWSADRGAVAGQAALHMRTEGGYTNVLGDFCGFGTATPLQKINVQSGAIRFDYVPTISCAGVTWAAGGAGVNTPGNHTLKVTAVNPLGETELGTVSPPYTVTVAGEEWVASNIPVSPDPTVTSRNVYVTKTGPGATWYKIAGLLPDNTTTSCTINVADAGLTVSGSSYNTTSGKIYTAGIPAIMSDHLGSLTFGGNGTITQAVSGYTTILPGVTGIVLFETNAAAVMVQINQYGIGLLNCLATSTQELASRGIYASTWGKLRHTTADTAGYALSLIAGGATIGATNKAGGNLLLYPGVSTGSGIGDVLIYAYPGIAAATTDNTAVDWVRVSGTGVYIGPTTTTPAAYLHLDAGTATAGTAPLKLTNGILLATLEGCAVEKTANTYWGTIGTDGGDKARQSFDGTLYSQVAPEAVVNTAAETTLVDTAGARGSVVLPDEFFTAGKTLRVTARGHYSTDNVVTLNLRIRLNKGGTIYLMVATGDLSLRAAQTKMEWSLKADIVCRTSGAAGTIFSLGEVFIWNTDAYTHEGWELYNPAGTDASIVVDTRDDLTFNLTADFGAAAPAISITCEQLYLETID